jgi:hypothetical protein
MATKAEIKKAILEVAGNPDSGVIAEYADRFADAIVGLDNPASVDATQERPAKETRVTKLEEVR